MALLNPILIYVVPNFEPGRPSIFCCAYMLTLSPFDAVTLILFLTMSTNRDPMR